MADKTHRIFWISTTAIIVMISALILGMVIKIRSTESENRLMTPNKLISNVSDQITNFPQSTEISDVVSSLNSGSLDKIITNSQFHIVETTPTIDLINIPKNEITENFVTLIPNLKDRVSSENYNNLILYQKQFGIYLVLPANATDVAILDAKKMVLYRLGQNILSLTFNETTKQWDDQRDEIFQNQEGRIILQFEVDLIDKNKFYIIDRSKSRIEVDFNLKILQYDSGELKLVNKYTFEKQIEILKNQTITEIDSAANDELIEPDFADLSIRFMQTDLNIIIAGKYYYSAIFKPILKSDLNQTIVNPTLEVYPFQIKYLSDAACMGNLCTTLDLNDNSIITLQIDNEQNLIVKKLFEENNKFTIQNIISKNSGSLKYLVQTNNRGTGIRNIGNYIYFK